MPWNTLLIRLVSNCDGECYGCPLRTHEFKEKTILSYKLFNKLIKSIEGSSFDEAVFLCPNPFQHPRLEHFIELVKNISKRVYLLSPLKSIKPLNKNIIEKLDELIFIVSNRQQVIIREKMLKTLISQGIDNISIYLSTRSLDGLLENILSILCTIEKYSIKLRVGEPPYMNVYSPNIVDYIRKRGYEVSLPYGYFIGYRAYSAFIENRYIGLLEKPLFENCRKLYIDPFGRVSKCPLTLNTISKYIDKANIDDIRIIMFSDCNFKIKMSSIVPYIHISFLLNDNVVIPKDVLDLLEVLLHVRSFRQACQVLGYNPSTYIYKIRVLEKKLGYKLLKSYKGGYKKGSTTLTPEALRIVEKYKKLREYISKKLFEGNYVNFMI